MQKKCLICGSEDIGVRYDGKEFCRNCGEEVIHCAVCGSYDFGKKSSGEFFCKNCGASGDILLNGIILKEEKNTSIKQETPKPIFLIYK